MTDTQKLVTDLLSFHWWVTAVVVALLINVLSTFVSRAFDRALSNWSKNRRESSSARAELNERIARHCASSPMLLAIEIRSELLCALVTAACVAASAALMAIPVTMRNLVIETPQAVQVTVQILCGLAAVLTAMLAIYVFGKLVLHSERLVLATKYIIENDRKRMP